MANTVISLLSSGESGNTPLVGELANGELALNFADGIIFYKTTTNTLGQIKTVEPSGLDGEIQFNDSGVFGSNANLTFDKTTGKLETSNVTADSLASRSYVQFGDGTRQFSANVGDGDGGGSTITFDAHPPESGNAIGDIWIDSGTGTKFEYIDDGDSSQWVEFGAVAASEPIDAVIIQESFNATSNQTTFEITGSYTANLAQVFLNGVKLVNGVDVNVSSGTEFVLTEGASANDNVDFVGFDAFSVADTYTQAQADAKFVEKTSSTGAAFMPVGTTAERPTVPETGMFRMNSTTGEPEWYDEVTGQWQKFRSLEYQVEYLVVAGGAGGGSGGGGAGGYRSSVIGESSGGGASAEAVIVTISGTAFTVTVGAGGSAGNAEINGSNGANSVFGAITALGGGFGNGYAVAGSSGGSGGSGGGGHGRVGGTSGVGGAGTTGQGRGGGNGTTPNFQSGGGGGASTAGANGITSGGDGGAGVASSITGTSVFRGGGGGGTSGVNSAGAGGAGGGGAGGLNAAGVAGTANTGGGGGGGAFVNSTNLNAGAGGSGIVIIRYSGPQRGTGGTVTSSGGFTIHTFTSSGTYTA